MFNKKILLLGAHPGDLEFGMGGSMWRLNHDADVLVLSTTDEANNSLYASMKHYKFGYEVRKDIPAAKFTTHESEIKQILSERSRPEVVFCPSLLSTNIDHYVTAKCVNSVFQEQTIINYEIIRTDTQFRPNFWVRLAKTDLEAKLMALGLYDMREKRDYISYDQVAAHMRFRGAQVGMELAEAFNVTRLIV